MCLDGKVLVLCPSSPVKRARSAGVPRAGQALSGCREITKQGTHIAP